MGIVQDTKEVLESIGDLSRTIRDFQTGMSVSLPSYLRSTNIMSRTYIEDCLAEEDITVPLLGMVTQMYVGFVMTALQLNQHVSRSKTIRNLLEVVASEAYESTMDKIKNAFGEKVYIEDSKVLSMEAKEQKLFSGRVIEMDLALADDKTSKVLMYVQLIPYLITESVTKQIISLNVGKDLGIRFKKMRTGEISFFWDFLLNRDLINDKQKAMKEDRTGVVYDILVKQSNALSKALLRFVGIVPKNHNLANTVLVLTENTFRDVCVQTNTNFNNKSSRDKFFKESFVMMVCIVDTMYNHVTFYFNGLDTEGEYSFKMIQANSGSGASGTDKWDLKTIMTAMSHGMVPKF